MQHHRIEASLRRLVQVSICLFVLLAPDSQRAAAQGLPIGSDDSTLFSTAVAPNVVLMIDNSGSMNHVVWHESYDSSVPASTSGCTFFNDSWTYYVRSSYYWSGSNPNDSTVEPGTYTICNNTREIFLDSDVAAAGNSTRWTGHYLNWYFSNAADAVASQIAATGNGTVSACLGGGTFPLYRRARVTAAKDVLREVICEVNAVGAVRFGIAQFRRSHYPDIDSSSSDPSGAYVRVPINDYLDSETSSPFVYSLNGVTQSHGDHLDDAIDALEGETWTPLAESLFQVYTYLMSRESSKRPVGADGSTLFPEYEYRTTDSSFGGPFSSSGPPTVPDSPVQYDCQKNFVIIITDGEPTRDDFDEVAAGYNLVNGFDDFDDLIGDYNPDGEDEEPGGFTGCSNCEATRWLDDVAMFMQNNDFRPDLSGDQVIDVYTVGFTTSAFANAILQKTADVGNGQFFFSNDARTLSAAIVSAVTDIIQKSQGFTAATVPASRSTDGNNFFTTYFNPRPREAFWDGHLKLFEFTLAGEIRDKPVVAGTLGECALDDPNEPAECASGPLKLNLNGWWDAADEVPAADEGAVDPRNLFVSDFPPAPATIPTVPPAFTSATIDEYDLGLDIVDPASEIAKYSGVGNGTSGIGNLGALADAIVRWIRGCEFGSGPCIDRGDGEKLWDIFHSTPVVVGPPNAPISNLGYREFARKYAHRKRVIYAGSNGGFVHGFDAGEWRTTISPDVPAPPGYDRGTGTEEMGFMPYPGRRNIKELPIDLPPREYYMVDGSPQAADVWLYPSALASPSGASSWNDWRTVLIGGMREGGEVLYALDVTNPPDDASPGGIAGGPAYPGYMWEFPCEQAACDSIRPLMGETWSEPVITRVKVTVNCSGSSCTTYDRWVAIFGTGYSAEGDPNEPTLYDASMTATTSRKGRGIVMVDITTGQVLAARSFDANPALGVPEMQYAFASAPAVFDLDFDGYADVVYIGDLGGNVWKWVVRAPGQDPINGAGDESQPDWPFVRYFEATPCTAPDCSTSRYKSMYFPASGTFFQGDIFLAFGTGARRQLDFIGTVPEERDRFFVIKDQDPFELNPPAGSFSAARYDDDDGDGQIDVVDRDTLQLQSGCQPPPVGAIGFYAEGIDGEKFVTSAQIFFGIVLTGSYVPNVSTSPCDVGGQAFLHVFDLLCGAGELPGDLPTDPLEDRVPIGQGMPNVPRISVGALDAQDPNDCDNMVVMVTSDGDAFTDCPTTAPSSGVRMKSWRDE